ncbi:MAG: tetratricopeptide repeat protein [Myxococcales bacterium FL481]|nr:MAG: tetratricopeptide repeat protein [Myxococcales bacterium FL481]
MESLVASEGTDQTRVRRLSLEQTSPARVYFALLKRRFSGALGLEQAGVRRHVWFRGGMPVYTDWDSPADVLSEVLIGRELVSPAVCEAGLAIKVREGGSLGRILVERGELDEAMLAAALSEQCARKVSRTFELRSGPAWVDPVGPTCAELGGTTQAVNGLGLIRAGVVAYYDSPRIEVEMGNTLSGSVITTDAFLRYREHFGFRRRERAVLPLLERGVAVDEVRAQASSTEVALHLIYCLWVCQMLRSAPDRSLVGARPEGFPPLPDVGSGARPWPRSSVTAGDATVAGTGPVGHGQADGRSRDASAEPGRSAAANQRHESSTGRSPPGAREVPNDSGRRPAPSAGRSPPAALGSRPEPSTAGVSPVGREDAATASPGREASAARTVSERREHSSGGRLPRSDDPFEEQLLTLESKIRAGAHPFALMGLALDAGRKDVRSAWAVLSLRFHPDALEAEGRGHLRDRVQQVFAALSEANATLSNGTEREKLRHALEIDPDAHSSVDPTAVVRNALEAEMLARDADKFLKAGNYPRALELYERSLSLAPREVEVTASAAWCQFQLTQRSRGDAVVAIQTLEAAVTEQPKCARAHYYLGLARLAAGLEKLALTSFEAAHACDAKLIDAERQARAIRLKQKNRGRVNETKRGFGLRGLFGRKEGG